MQANYIVAVLNSGNEWELMDAKKFSTVEEAEQWAHELVEEYEYDAFDIVAV